MSPRVQPPLLQGFRGQLGPPGPTGPPLISQKRTSDHFIEERPPDHITIEEMRLDLAVKVGPHRLHNGRSRRHILAEGVPAPIVLGKGKGRLPTFVRVELVDGFDPCFIDLSTQLTGSAILSRTVTEYMDVVLLVGEILFATAYQIPNVQQITNIKVTEVII